MVRFNKDSTLKLLLLNFIVLLMSCSDPSTQVNFKNLQEVSDANFYIVCPPSYCSIKPNEISPVFPFDMYHLNIHWQEVVAQLPRLTIVAEDKINLKFTYSQRSKYFRLPSVINVQLVGIDKGHSTIAISSQSKYGYIDFGGNESRVDAWLQDLIDSVGKQHNLGHSSNADTSDKARSASK